MLFRAELADVSNKVFQVFLICDSSFAPPIFYLIIFNTIFNKLSLRMKNC